MKQSSAVLVIRDESERYREATTVLPHTPPAAFSNIGGSERDNSSAEYSYKAGFTGGAVIAFDLSRFAHLQAELNFVSKRTQANAVISRFDYLEVPLLIGGHLAASNELALHAEFGPTFALLLDANILVDGTQFELNRTSRSYDVGLTIGAGGAWTVSKAIGAITLDARYNHGLVVRNKNATADSEILNRAFYVAVGYRADLATLGRLFGGSDGSRPADAAPPATAPADVAPADAAQPAAIEPAPASPSAPDS